MWITNDTKCVGNIRTSFRRSREGELSSGTTGSKLVKIFSFVLQKEEDKDHLRKTILKQIDYLLQGKENV